MSEDRAVLTEDYLVYLAMHDVEVDIPAGAEFTVFAKVRDGFLGVYIHPEYGEITIDTPHAVRITPLVPGVFVLHGKKESQ